MLMLFSPLFAMLSMLRLRLRCLRQFTDDYFDASFAAATRYASGAAPLRLMPRDVDAVATCLLIS